MLHNQKLGPEICSEDFSGRLVVITGATSGIGFATARKYAAHGADILCINRSEEKSRELRDHIEKDFRTKCTYLIADFTKLSDIHAAGKHLAELDSHIDVFIHNAGVYLTQRTVTADNLEMVFQVNYLASNVLNSYLKEKLIRQGRGRIIFVNSEAYRFAVWGLDLDDLGWEKHRYSGLKSYGAAKMAQLLSMIKWDELFSESGVTINAMHPGNVKTNSGQNNSEMYKWFKKFFIDRSAKSPEVSAEALYYLGASKKLEMVSGKFFNLTTEEELAPPALDKDAADKLWAISQTLGGLN